MVLEEEGLVSVWRLGGEQRIDREHDDLGAVSVFDGAVGQAGVVGVDQVGHAIGAGYAGLPEIDVEIGAVALEDSEVVRGGLDCEYVGPRIAVREPQGAGADVGAAVDDERLTAGGDDLVVEAID